MTISQTFDFDTIIDRRDSASEKWDKYAGRDILPLWVADMDFPSPPEVIEALRERVDHRIFGYTHAPHELVSAVLDRLHQEYGWQVDPSWLVWLPGLVCGLNVACRAVGAQNDEVITFTPIYPPFMSAPALSGRTPVKVPLQLREGRWELDLAGLERAITPARGCCCCAAPTIRSAGSGRGRNWKAWRS